MAAPRWLRPSQIQRRLTLFDCQRATWVDSVARDDTTQLIQNTILGVFYLTTPIGQAVAVTTPEFLPPRRKIEFAYSAITVLQGADPVPFLPSQMDSDRFQTERLPLCFPLHPVTDIQRYRVPLYLPFLFQHPRELMGVQLKTLLHRGVPYACPATPWSTHCFLINVRVNDSVLSPQFYDCSGGNRVIKASSKLRRPISVWASSIIILRPSSVRSMS